MRRGDVRAIGRDDPDVSLAMERAMRLDKWPRKKRT